MLDRATLAAIHVAKKDRGLDDDAYRDMMERVAGVRSASALDANGARLVMLEFERLGFAGTNNRKGTASDRRPIVLKARALWISLWLLDEVSNQHDKALDAFTKRTTGKDTLHFCTNGEAGKVVEALKAWCLRVDFLTPTGPYSKLEPERQLTFVLWSRLHAATDSAVLDHFRPSVEAAPRLGIQSIRFLNREMGTELRRRKLGSRHRETSQTNGQNNA